MRFILVSLEMNHAIDAGERRASTLVAMGVEFLLRKDITARLEGDPVSKQHSSGCRIVYSAYQNKDSCDSPRIGTTP